MDTLRLLVIVGVCYVSFFNVNAGNPRFDLTLGVGPAVHIEKVNPELEYEEFSENLGVSYQVGGGVVIEAAEELKFHIGMSINYSKVSKTLQTRYEERMMQHTHQVDSDYKDDDRFKEISHIENVDVTIKDKEKKRYTTFKIPVYTSIGIDDFTEGANLILGAYTSARMSGDHAWGVKEKYYSPRPDKYHDAYRDSDWTLHRKNNFTSDKAEIAGEDLSEHQQPVNWGGRIGLGFEDEEGFITFRMMYDFGLSNTFAGFKENNEGYTKDDMVTKQNAFLFELGFNLSE